MPSDQRLKSPPVDSRLTSEYDYDLPVELIAQEPLAAREDSRLLVLNRATGPVELTHFARFPDLLRPDDTLVVNNTRVTARRLWALRSSGARVEMFVFKKVGPGLYESLVKPGKRCLPGETFTVEDSSRQIYIEGKTAEGGRLLRFTEAEDADEWLAKAGVVPLPPYIRATLGDESRYQTVFSHAPGSSAAPTAALHFTPEILAEIRSSGIKVVEITLDIGLGTFRPIKTDLITEHEMHEETFTITAEAAAAINERRGRLVAIGTTTVRALESSASADGQVTPASQQTTSLFINPGYRFKVVDCLLTNFHMPRSTLPFQHSGIRSLEFT